MNRSALFTSYNLARRMVRQGAIDGDRLNRALGICQAKQQQNLYASSATDCMCPDRRYRLRWQGLACKHMLAEILREVSK